ncbi:ABC transporter permease [Cohnella herbarum]|uniref:ABC transporter permease n=1 Tax=Cohnella herbarum TaxID=2728023 RepID=A0A7Z2VJE8_9BACL|nr:ABC transporter permease [Cohnella herbarum]QJD84091.1 ABC transporter permease [Cohnella herbarum]
MREKGQEEQLGFMRSLRRSRAAAFRQEIVPHFRYVFQSGFGLFVSAIFFTVLVWYVGFIKAVPEGWPVEIVGVALISLGAVRAPLRAYFRPADSVFLLPMENRLLRFYIQPALRKAIVMAVLRTLALFLLFAPIYVRSPDTAHLADSHPLFLLGALFAIVAGCNVYGGWRERRPAARSWRLGLKLVRWLLTLLIVANLLLKPLTIAIPLMLLCMAIVALLWRIPAQHALPWEKLIDEEAAVRRRWMAFLGWFVDVPSETSKPARRRWIAWAGELLAWQRRRAWHYLYAKAFLRGETFGALWRWVILSGIVLVVSGNAVADAIIYAVSFLIVGLQLSELGRVRFVETAATVPLEPEGRLVAASAIARVAGLGAVLLLGVVGILTVKLGAAGERAGVAGGEGMEAFHLNLWLPLIVAGLLWCGWWIPRKIAKLKDEDDL